MVSSLCYIDGEIVVILQVDATAFYITIIDTMPCIYHRHYALNISYTMLVSFRWALCNRTQLRSQNSSLEFRLHRLSFIQLMKQGISKQNEALVYAKKFEPFAETHGKGIYSLKIFLQDCLRILMQMLQNERYVCICIFS